MKHTSRAGTSALVGLLRKEIYHILRDRRTLFVIAFLPVVQLVIFGYAIRTDVTEARLPSDGPGQLTNSRAPDLAQPGSAEVGELESLKATAWQRVAAGHVFTQPGPGRREGLEARA